MFADSFLPNLGLFVAGQATAWFYLRTGRLWVGGLTTATLWVTADWAVVAKFVFDDEGPQFSVPLAVMQLSAIAIVLLLAFEQWRRRWSKTAKERSALFQAGMAAYLRRSHDEARATFRRLVRTDPWDAAAWLALGNTQRRRKELGAARRCYRRCMRVDRDSEYTDLARRMAKKGP